MKWEVVLPMKYHAVIERLYEKLNLDRTVITSSQSLNKNLATDEAPIDADYCSKREVLHIYTKKAGINLAESVSALIVKYQPKITHIDIPLDNVTIDSVVDNLNDIGFFFCALLPEFAQTDLIRLQAITSIVPDDLELNLINEDAIGLGEFICQSAC